MKPRLLNDSDRDSQSSVSASRRPHKISAVLISGVGFLADAYDLFVIDFVVAILASTSFVEPTPWDKSLIVSSTLAGAVVGQLLFGIAADFLGRKVMFVTTAFLVICGSVLSSIVGFGYTVHAAKFSIFHQLAICRFFLGCGIGGEYPLSATVTAENDSLEDVGVNDSGKKSFLWYLSHKPNSVAAVFSMQGVGMLLSPLIVMACVSIGLSLELTWRLCLCVGAIPSAIAFVFRWRMSETPAFTKSQNDYSMAESAVTAVTSLYTVPYSATPVPSSTQGEETSLEYLPYLKEPKKTMDTKTTAELIALKSKEDILAASFEIGQVQNCLAQKNLDCEIQDTQNIVVQQNTQERSTVTIPATVGGLKKKSWKAFGKHLKQCFWIISCLRIVLLGTSSTWFLIDVTLYGTGSFKSAIVANWFLETPTRQLSEVGVNNMTHLQIPPIDLNENLEQINNEKQLRSTKNTVDEQYEFNNVYKATPIYRQLSFNSINSLPNFQRNFIIQLLSKRTSRFEKRYLKKAEDPVNSQSVRSNIMLQAQMGAIVALLAIPGYILSIFFIHKVGTRQLQFWGFVAVALVFITLGLEQLLVKTGIPGIELTLFGLTFLCSNFGPNTTTFILPTLVYPTIVRATCHGFSAAMGKLGGVVGTSFFSIIERSLGLGWLLFICGIVSVAGAACTFLIPKDLKAKKHFIGETMTYKIHLPMEAI